jgi:DNA-binding transcriptional ArsR family regulator
VSPGITLERFHPVIELPIFPVRHDDLRPPHPDAAIVTAALLADRVRASILVLLREGPRCVCELAAAMDEREHNVSNQLARLRAAGLVRASRRRIHGHWTFYERDETACRVALQNLEEVLG